ncbi:hypothetical protein [Haloarchaeobius iranensis]|uniref:hypothetical protein n=1 Tax=Haloarchaeobius iranensis TaxID=996166 RepID=UPI0011143A4A|nr:hypothetical protein [Haloarchaeobius iranensis]
MSKPEWKYLSSSRIDSHGRIKIPEELFELGILKPPEESPQPDAWWSYEKRHGWVVLSDEPLEGERFKPFNVVGRRKIGGKSDNHRVTIPNEFIDDSSESVHSVAQKVPSIVRFDPDAELHFLTYEDMIQSSPHAAIVLTTNKLNRMLSGKVDEPEENLPW